MNRHTEESQNPGFIVFTVTGTEDFILSASARVKKTLRTIKTS
jgi:hypothetical protein